MEVGDCGEGEKRKLSCAMGTDLWNLSSLAVTLIHRYVLFHADAIGNSLGHTVGGSDLSFSPP